MKHVLELLKEWKKDRHDMITNQDIEFLVFARFDECVNQLHAACLKDGATFPLEFKNEESK
jgi:hypothetical protein